MKVAIVASGHGKYEAPIGDPAWECWGVNTTWAHFNHHTIFDKFARWFELHRRAYLEWENSGSDGQHFAWLHGQEKLPIYVQDVTEWPDMKTARVFPFERVQAILPGFGYYHACSIDWLIAYAISEGATEIRLFGVEQDHTAEPIGSRACVEFWMGFAAARGITVSSAQGSTFKLAHLCYTKTPYALDPLWLPFEDRTDGTTTAIGDARAKLAAHLSKAARIG